MKNYETPELSVVKLDTSDVIATQANTRYEVKVDENCGNLDSDWISALVN